MTLTRETISEMRDAAQKGILLPVSGYVAACSPDRILSLLDEIESRDARIKKHQGEIERLGKVIEDYRSLNSFLLNEKELAVHKWARIKRALNESNELIYNFTKITDAADWPEGTRAQVESNSNLIDGVETK